MKSTITYLKNFIKDKDVASITPSSKFCIRKVCDHIDFKRDNVIIEYGAGTGVFTRYLLQRLSKNSRLIVFETNPEFFKKLRKIDDPRLQMYNESVEHVIDLIGESLRGEIDYIISGIPFSFLDDRTKLSILKQSLEVLKEGGKFLAYQTSGHLKTPLKKVFGDVSTKLEFLNVPPMMIYEAVKNGRAA